MKKTTLLLCIALVLIGSCVSLTANAKEKREVSQPSVNATANDDDALSAQDAVVVLRAMADVGSSKAQYELGVSYMNGQGVPQDYTQAAQWFRKAADQGVDFDLAVELFFLGETRFQPGFSPAQWNITCKLNHHCLGQQACGVSPKKAPKGILPWG